MDEPRDYKDLPECPRCHHKIGKPGALYLTDNPDKARFCKCYPPGTVGFLLESLKHVDPTIYVYMESDLKYGQPRPVQEVSIVKDTSWEEPQEYEDHVILS